MAADAETHVAMLLSVEDMATDVITRAQKQVEAAVDAVAGALDRSISSAEKATLTIGSKLKGAASSAAVSVWDLAKGLGKATVGTIGKGLEVGILGPFSALFKLLSPITDALVDTFMPAMRTFGDIVKSSLAPLEFLFETMAQQLAPLVVKWIAPLVKMLEIAAVHLGSFLADMLDTGEAANPLSRIIEGLMPVAEQVFKILPEVAKVVLDLGKTLLPVILDAFTEIAPVVAETVKLLGVEMVGIVKELAGVFKESGPLLIKTFADLLKSVLPLLPALMRLANVVVRDILAPASIKALTTIAEFIADPIIPFIEKWLPKLIELMKWLGEVVTDFFGPKFTKYMSDFKVLIIDPFIDFISLGKPEGFLKVFTAPIESIKKGINVVIDYLNDILRADLPFTDATLGSLVKLPEGIPYLARGAAMVNTPSIAGEAGPEMVMPLTSENVERVLTPILPKVEMPGMDEAVDWLSRIHKTLTGTLRVEQAGGRSSSSSTERAGVGDAVGLMGLVGGA